MKTNLLQRKRLLTEESNRCYLCDAPVCTKACKPGLDPGRLLRACKMDNLAGAILRAYQMEACRDCDGHPCEKACLRGRTDRAISITQIVRQLQDMPNPTDSSPLTSSPDLAIDFCGIRCANPFILASSPVAHNYEMCVRALEAGWAGICFKTISFYPSHEVSPRFDQMEVDGVPFIGFKNMEQLSEASVEENFDTLYRLKQRYPDKLIISSIMGRTDDEWTRLAQYSTQAGADIIECNFSCPQMTQEGMGSDVGQSPELVRRFTAATRRGTHLPILAKMTPNIGQMTPVALAAHEGGATGIAAINAVRADKCSVTTLEGLQEEAAEFVTFIADQGAEQCGFCNPGFVMNAIALFRENPYPDEDEIKEFLSGNLCRCSGYEGQLYKFLPDYLLL